MKICGKVKYKFEKDAWYAAYGIHKKYGREQSAYLCRIDGYYHLTSRKGRLPEWLIEEILNGKVK